MTGMEAAEHLTVGGIDDRAAFQRGDIPLPKKDVILNRLYAGNIGNTLLRVFFL